MMRVDRANRVISAPAKRLYEAFLKSHEFIQWLPPQGMTGEIVYFDAQIGGEFKIILFYTGDEPGKSGGHQDIIKGRFIDLIPHKKIVIEIVFESEDDAFHGTMIQEWLYEARESATMVRIRCTDVPSGIRQEDHEGALESTLDNLNTFICG